MTQRDYYEVLGVDRSAPPERVREAYRRLARKYHPDVNKAPDAADRFKEATAAYEVLSDPEKRKAYDQFGRAAPAGRSPFGGAGRGPDGGVRVQWGPAGMNFEDLFASSPFSGMGLEELLGALGGRGRTGRKRRGVAPAPGGDIEHRVTLDFIQAVKGCTVRLELGRAGQTEQIEVKIPPGVREGSRIRVRGKGQVGPAGAGDLYIVTSVREHPYFRREGADIHLDLPISITEAALGAEVTVPTVDGPAVLKVPPGSGGGTRLRLRGKGAADPKAGTRGDQYVLVKVVLPEAFSEEGKRLLKELARSDSYDARKKVRW